VPYVDIDQLIERYGESELIQLTDREASGFIEHEVLNRAIADAVAEIDSYLSARYVVPVTPAPPVLALHAANITRYRLYEDDTTEEVERRYRDALSWLRDIRDGRQPLDGAVPLSNGAHGRAAGGDREMIFTDSLWAQTPGGST